MSIKKAFSHDCIILDACCIISLYASGKMRPILEAIPKSLSVAAYVKDNEALNIYIRPNNKEAIDLEPFINDNILLVVDIETEEEKNTYIDLSMKLDDGEAITGAIALNRNWAMATDDAATTRLLQSGISDIALVSTLELVKNWFEVNKENEEIVRETLSNIRVRGKYEPNRNHPLRGWWDTMLK